jgi:hypothetical protein
MSFLSASMTRARMVAALALVAGLAAAVWTAAQARAALSGSNWAQQTLPPNFVIADGSNGPALSPVSCVPGTRFCLVVAADQAVTVNGFFIGHLLPKSRVNMPQSAQKKLRKQCPLFGHPACAACPAPR